MKIKVEFDETIQEEDPKNVDYQLLILKILEDDTYFERKIKEIRTKFQIPRNGYKRTEKDIKIIENKGFEDDLQTEIYVLRDKYYFPAEWSVSLFHYVLFNRFVFAKVNEIEIFEEKKLYQNLVGKRKKYLGTDSSIFIKINADSNFDNLVKKIKQEYPQIKAFFNENRFCEPIKKIPVKILDTYQKIYDLKVRKNKSLTFIADELEKNNGRCLSENEVSAMLNRYRKLIKKLRRKE